LCSASVKRRPHIGSISKKLLLTKGAKIDNRLETTGFQIRHFVVQDDSALFF
jgi:hypothetical protein